MAFRSVLLIVGLLAFSAPAATTVVLSGTTQDCWERTPDPVSGVTLSVFQKSKAAKLITQLKAMDNATFANGDYLAMSRFDKQYVAMVALGKKTAALARGTSGSDGAFAFTVTAVDSVLVVGYAAVEDEPYYYSYKVVSGLSNLSFVLDMTRGHCN